ncbi:MAG: 50S ribosomal protein L11 [Candidatus Aenigmatarchaeota archaeon]
MADIETIEMLVEGGKAKPGPATAPKLGELKVNIAKLFQDINDKTKEYAGMNVPVKVFVNTNDRSYKIEVGTPPVSSLLRKELKLEKIAYQKKEETQEAASDGDKGKQGERGGGKKKSKEKTPRVIIADVKIEQCIKIARMKRSSLLAKTFKAAVKEVVGSCASMPVTVEGKTPKEVLREIEQGKYDHLLKD